MWHFSLPFILLLSAFIFSYENNSAQLSDEVSTFIRWCKTQVDFELQPREGRLSLWISSPESKGRKKGLLAELSQAVARSHRKLTCIANPLYYYKIVLRIQGNLWMVNYGKAEAIKVTWVTGCFSKVLDSTGVRSTCV